MEKQPDRLDALMDWFLGDAREITEEQKSLLAKLSDMHQKLDEQKAALDSTADEARAEIIGSLRDIQKSLKEENKARLDFLNRFNSLQTSKASSNNRTIILSAVSSVILGIVIGVALTYILIK